MLAPPQRILDDYFEFQTEGSKNIIPLTSIFGYPAYTKFFLTIRILCGWRDIKRLQTSPSPFIGHKPAL